jgi:hypothetical protein
MSNEPPPILAPKLPRVIWWFKFFCAFGCFVNCAFALLSFLTVMIIREGDSLGIGALMSMLAVYVFVLSVVSFSINLIPLALSPKPWLWKYCLVLIIMQLLGSWWLVPAVIPLFICWFQPATKQYYGIAVEDHPPAFPKS